MPWSALRRQPLRPPAMRRLRRFSSHHLSLAKYLGEGTSQRAANASLLLFFVFMGFLPLAAKGQSAKLNDRNCHRRQSSRLGRQLPHLSCYPYNENRCLKVIHEKWNRPQTCLQTIAVSDGSQN